VTRTLAIGHDPRVIIRLLRREGQGSDAAGPAETPETGDTRRVRFARAAGRVNGLETLVLGWHASGTAGASADSPSVVMIAWRDVESMLTASGRDETALLRDRLGVSMEIGQAETFEVTSRTFASLPTSTSVMRILTFDVRPNVEGALFELLRELQARLTDRGLIASHVARRATLDRTEALVVGVWRDHEAIDAATRSNPARPAFAEIIDPLVESVSIETFDSLEIAPRLPLASGPPILVLDGSKRIVDLTPAAAATLGRTQDEAVGLVLDDLTAPDSQEAPVDWAGLLADRNERQASGEAVWAVPSGGDVLLRWQFLRDVPVIGRHSMLVRRRQDPPPTAGELEAALAEAFPRDPTLIRT
jgi:PAS domain-containing protein